MPKKNSAWMPAPRKNTRLDHWVGHHQHTANGVASDPAHQHVPKGKLSSKQYLKEEFQDRD